MRLRPEGGERSNRVAAAWARLDPFQRRLLRLAALGFVLALGFALGSLYFATRPRSGGAPAGGVSTSLTQETTE